MKVGVCTAYEPPPAEHTPAQANTRKLPAQERSERTVLDFPARAALPRSAGAATTLARNTTALIAESNLAAVRSHGLDVERLLDLLT